VLLLAALLFAGACSDDPEDGSADGPDAPAAQTEPHRDKTTPPEGGPETTGEAPPPEVTLGQDPGGRPEVVIRLEGDPQTTFTGLCSVGREQKVLSGRVPKRFTFVLSGRPLECRIEKRDEGEGDLKVVLVAGAATRSVQQTNAPGGVINLSYRNG
jgi:hypothetical protein